MLCTTTRGPPAGSSENISRTFSKFDHDFREVCWEPVVFQNMHMDVDGVAEETNRDAGAEDWHATTEWLPATCFGVLCDFDELSILMMPTWMGHVCSPLSAVRSCRTTFEARVCANSAGILAYIAVALSRAAAHNHSPCLKALLPSVCITSGERRLDPSFARDESRFSNPCRVYMGVFKVPICVLSYAQLILNLPHLSVLPACLR